jgi:Peptidase family M23
MERKAQRGRFQRAVAIAAFATAAVFAAQASAIVNTPTTTRQAPALARTTETSCEHKHVAWKRPSYGWPVKPFHRQHAVRGYFGDPRVGGRPMGSSKSFHFGVDVSAPDGTPVYATTDGIVHLDPRHRGTVSIRRSDGAVFAYWHVVPAVGGGQRVTAYKTVIGHIAEGWEHVHFAEYRSGDWVNPLRPGAMGPYVDRTCPFFGELRFERDGRVLLAEGLGGRFDIIVGAFDSHAVPAPSPWTSLPVTPALVRWRIVGAGDRVVFPWRTAHDVRTRFPQIAYEAVYTADTEQNRPNRPGRYRFVLARGFDGTTLGSRMYTVQVVAVDTRGNRARSSWPLLIRH